MITNYLLLLLLLKLTTTSAAVINETTKHPTLAENFNKPTGGYIVRLRKGVNSRAFEEELSNQESEDGNDWEFNIDHRYKHIFEGFSGQFSDELVAAIEADDRVERVIPDVYGTLDQVQMNAEWALTRISHRNQTSSTTERTYEYPDHGGEGVKVYVMDSGVDPLADEFEDRLSNGINCVDEEGWEDLEPHGTMVASLIGGVVYGVAKKVKLVSVKVCGKLGCPLSQSLLGFEWIHKQANSGKVIINYSITMPASTDLDQVVETLVNKGIPVISSAGNGQHDACDASPRRLTKSVLAVGSTNNKDEMAWFSNFGPCVGIFAPGDDVKAARPKKAPSYGEVGTSFSAPLVTGAAALLLHESPSLSPEQLYAELKRRATPNLVILPSNLKDSTTGSFLYLGPPIMTQPEQKIEPATKNVIIKQENSDPIFIIPHPIKNKL